MEEPLILEYLGYSLKLQSLRDLSIRFEAIMTKELLAMLICELMQERNIA
jgi:hypothetical protein